MKAADALRWAARRIGGDTARLDAELLLAALIDVSREILLIELASLTVDPDAYAALIDRRVAGEPLAYITGTREFWSLPLRVTPAVLIPRPDSETLIDAALQLRAGRPPSRILDLGTGSGALLLAALSEWPGAYGIGIDRSEAALAVARANAAALGLMGRADFIVGDWAGALSGPFDLVLANPPYVADAEPLDLSVRDHEPASALFAGPEGLDCYRAILPDLGRILAPSGAAILEIGHRQADTVSELARIAGFVPRLWHDLAGRPRAISLGGGASEEVLGSLVDTR